MDQDGAGPVSRLRFGVVATGSINISYYPSLMAAAAGFAAYIFVGTQHWEDSRLFVVAFSLVSFWLVVWLELVGLRIGKWVQNVGAISTWVAAVLPVVLGAMYLVKFGSVTPFDPAALIPGADPGHLSTWAFLCFAMAGFELISLLGGEIKDPETNIPRSIVVGGAIATLIYILGTASLIVSVPHGTISMISGILQALTEQSRVFKLWLLPNAVAVLLVIGQFGGAGAWLAGSGRMLLMVGVDRYMPKSFSSIHPRWGTPHVAILVQAVIASVIVLMSALGANGGSSFTGCCSIYNLIIYFIPYLYLFAAYLKFMRKGEMPMNLAGILSVILGFSATLVAIILSFLPPANEPTRWGTS